MIKQTNPLAGYLSHKADIDSAVLRVLAGGRYVLGDEVSAFEQEFADAMGASWALGVASGTDAIELSLRAIGVQAGDSVATVSHTAVATVAAIARIGASPIFVDIDPARYTMDPDSLDEALRASASRNLRAVVVVHLYGQPADMPRIMEIADRHGIPVIEDCAQAHGAMLGDRHVGSWGEMGCHSFYPTKNLGAIGDAGAVVGQSEKYRDNVALLREYGWRERYVSSGFGFNSRLDEIQAAILRVKLRYLESDNAARRSLAAAYDGMLGKLHVRVPRIFPGVVHAYHQYVIACEDRDDLRATLLAADITTLIHYPVPVHRQPAYELPSMRPVSLANTESLVSKILSLPMYPELTAAEVQCVCKTVAEHFY